MTMTRGDMSNHKDDLREQFQVIFRGDGLDDAKLDAIERALLKVDAYVAEHEKTTATWQLFAQRERRLVETALRMALNNLGKRFQVTRRPVTYEDVLREAEKEAG